MQFIPPEHMLFMILAFFAAVTATRRFRLWIASLFFLLFLCSAAAIMAFYWHDEYHLAWDTDALRQVGAQWFLAALFGAGIGQFVLTLCTALLRRKPKQKPST